MLSNASTHRRALYICSDVLLSPSSPFYSDPFQKRTFSTSRETVGVVVVVGERANLWRRRLADLDGSGGEKERMHQIALAVSDLSLSLSSLELIALFLSLSLSRSLSRSLSLSFSLSLTLSLSVSLSLSLSRARAGLPDC
jgi:hypothetical protein